MFKVILVALCLTNLSIMNGSSDVNWNSFEIQQEVDDKVCADLIKSIPVKQYWDVLKASFRTGIIGNEIVSEHPYFVSIVDRKVTVAKVVHTVESFAVDTSLLFMHYVSAVKHLDILAEKVRQKLILPNLAAAFLWDQNISHSKSIPELIAEQSYLNFKILSLQHSLVLHKQRHLNRVNNIAVRSAAKRKDLSMVHDSSLRDIKFHHMKINMTNVDKYISMNDIAVQIEQQRLGRESSALGYIFNEDVLLLQKALNVTLSSIQYRTDQELQLLKQQNSDELVMLVAKTALLQAETEELLNAFFSEVYNSANNIYANPDIAIMAIKCIMMAVVAILVLLEGTQFVSAILKKLSNRNFVAKIMPEQKIYYHHSNSSSSSSSDNNCNINSKNNIDIIFSRSMKIQYHRAMNAMQTAVQCSLPLPNLLITGPPGCGKSLFSQALLLNQSVDSATTTVSVAVARDVTTKKEEEGVMRVIPSYVILCGGDLQSLGQDAAALYLNELIHTSVANKSRLVLILDEADNIIYGRRRRRKHQSTCEEREEDDDQSSSSMMTSSSSSSSYWIDNTSEDMNNNHESRSNSSSATVANSCLYSLLTGLRCNSTYISVIISTRLGFEYIDEAILDRMDSFIMLSLPGQRERLEYIVKTIQKPESCYGNRNSRKIVDTTTNIIDGDATTSGMLHYADIHAQRQFYTLITTDGGDSSKDTINDAMIALIMNCNIKDAFILSNEEEQQQQQGIEQVTNNNNYDNINANHYARLDRPTTSTSSSQCCQNGNSCSNSNNSPETETPVATLTRQQHNSVSSLIKNNINKITTDDDDAVAVISSVRLLLNYIKSNLSRFSDDSFDVLICIKVLVLLSEVRNIKVVDNDAATVAVAARSPWSYRDLYQFLSAVRYGVLCNERCKLTTLTWMKELVYSFDK